ncbi:MAG: hypothetical protein M1817_002179 [Caeruleum heppii]|nr:MAG: hypothetical protein M1817_002179 [Caeruleum heppii]
MDQQYDSVGAARQSQTTSSTPGRAHDRPPIPPLHQNISSASEPTGSPAISDQPPVRPATVTATFATPPRIRRRNRVITSCLECRRRKLKCDKLHPCTNCVRGGARDCIFLAPTLDAVAQSKLTEMKEKVGTLERMLERDVTRGGVAAGRTPTGNAPPGELGSIKLEEHDIGIEDTSPLEDDREFNLEPTPLAVSDAAYEDDADDDLFDLGVRFGKMRLNERLGGYFRPRIAEETFLGDKADEKSIKIERALRKARENQGDPLPPAPDRPEVSIEDLRRPGPSYIAPSSGYFLGGNVAANTVETNSLIDFLPSKTGSDRLVQQYFHAVHPVARAVHQPSFHRLYNSFWADVARGFEPPASTFAVVLAVVFSAVASMREDAVDANFGVQKESLVENFRVGTEMALARANFLRSTKFETLQAFVLYLIPLCRDQISRAHSALVGTAIRIAQCMGLHRDGENYRSAPIERHVRRIIWHQICFLDIRTCEAQGPQPTIRRDEYDVQIPQNINDADLEDPTRASSVTRNQWTDATFSIIRFECIEMHRLLWVDRLRLEKKKISLMAILSKIERFRSTMQEKYGRILDPRIPVQKCAKLVMELLMGRMHIMVLHRFHDVVSQAIPDRFRQLIISSGTYQLECAVQLDTDPSLAPWAWYLGAHQQYHTAFLLLIEVFFNPARPEADRIWACCDYVFETEPDMTRNEKAQVILKDLRNKSAAYRDLRKLRASKEMEVKLGIRESEPDQDGSGANVPSTQVQTAEQSNVGINKSASTAAPHSIAQEVSAAPSVTAAKPPNGGQDPAANTKDEIMKDIDWDEWDRLFPPNGLIGDLSLLMEK